MMENAYKYSHGHCSVNPFVGRESVKLNPNGRGRKVVIVGAGPAGLMCADILADRGFDVTVIEKESIVGGQLNLADKPPHKEKMAWVCTDLYSKAKDKNIVSLETNGDRLMITSSSPEIGKIEEVMNVDLIKGENIKISFSAKYMMEALRSFNSEKIKLYFNGEIKPIIIREDDNGDLLQLILPIKTY